MTILHYTKMKRTLFYYSWDIIESILQKSPAVFVAAGSFEQHGYHLPVGTDIILAHEILEKLCEKNDLYYFPCTTYGQVWSARDFPGTISIEESVLTEYVFDAIKSIYRYADVKIILYSFHKGNSHVLQQVMRKAYDSGWKEIYILQHKDLEKEAQKLLRTPVPEGIWHAGELETSLMLYLKKSLVHMEKATTEFPTASDTCNIQAIPWKNRLQSGAFGDSQAASEETGKRLYEVWVNKLDETVKKILAKENEGR